MADYNESELKKNDTHTTEKVAKSLIQELQQGFPKQSKGITGCVECDRQRFMYCRCDHKKGGNDGNGSDNKPADPTEKTALAAKQSSNPVLVKHKTLVFSHGDLSPSTSSKNISTDAQYFKSQLADLTELKTFFGQQIAKLTEEYYCSARPEDIARFKAEKDLSIEIKEGVLILRSNDMPLLNHLVKLAYQAGKILPSTPIELMHSGKNHEQAAYTSPTPFNLQQILHPELTQN